MHMVKFHFAVVQAVSLCGEDSWTVTEKLEQNQKSLQQSTQMYDRTAHTKRKKMKTRSVQII